MHEFMCTELSIAKGQNTHISQVHTGHSQGQTICWGTKLVSIGLRGLTSYQKYFSIAMVWYQKFTTNNSKKTKNKKTKTKKQQQQWGELQIRGD